jgi:hypothetical protein
VAAILERSRRSTAPPTHHVPGPGMGRLMYSAAEVQSWLLGPRAHEAVEMAQLVILAGALGHIVLLDGREDGPPAVEIHRWPDDEHPRLMYAGTLAGARQWLEEAAQEGGAP